MDILRLLHDNKITENQADDYLDQFIGDFNEGKTKIVWYDAAELNKFERTAFAQTASLLEIMNLRYEGWPNQCNVCGYDLDYTKFGWWIVHTDSDMPSLKHIVCPGEKL